MFPAFPNSESYTHQKVAVAQEQVHQDSRIGHRASISNKESARQTLTVMFGILPNVQTTEEVNVAKDCSLRGWEKMIEKGRVRI